MKKPSTLQFKRRPYSVNYLHGFWTAWLKEIIIGARTKVRALTKLHNRPPIKAQGLKSHDFLSFKRAVLYFKRFRLRWEHLIIAFLLGALLFSSRTGRVFPDGLDIPHQAPKPIALMADTKLQPQAQVEAIYVAPPPPPPIVGVTGCGSDPNMAYIYQHESGCRTDAIGPNGPCGLGQALPCSKLPCSLSDWSCQNAWFTNYALSVYGSTYNAMLFWQSHSWW